jgi:hypothetical protein
MRRLAADETTEGEDRVILLRAGELGRRRGKLPGAGDAKDLDGRGLRAVLDQARDRALQQRLGDVGVEARGDDGEAPPGAGYAAGQLGGVGAVAAAQRMCPSFARLVSR